MKLKQILYAVVDSENNIINCEDLMLFENKEQALNEMQLYKTFYDRLNETEVKVHIVKVQINKIYED